MLFYGIVLVMDAFSYLLGVSLSDACLREQIIRTRYTNGARSTYKTPQTVYWFRLLVTSEAFVKRAADAIGQIRGRPCRYYPRKESKSRTTLKGMRADYVFDGWLLATTYKELYLRLKPARDAIRAGTYEWPEDVIPADVLTGVVDGDGHVHKRQRYIDIASIYPEAIADVVRRAGYRARTYRYAHQTVPHVRIPATDADHIDTIKRYRTYSA